MQTPRLRAPAHMAGLTLVELLISVSIAGAVTLGVASYGSQLWSDRKAAEFGERMVALMDETEALYSVRPDYSGLNVESAGNLGLLRNENKVSGGGVTHLYGGAITLGALSGVGFNNAAWGVNYAGIPAKVCLDVLHLALTVGDAVALKKGDSSSFSNWATKLRRTNAEVAGFPVDYRVVKNRRDVVPSVVDRIDACDFATNAKSNTFLDLAVVKGKM